MEFLQQRIFTPLEDDVGRAISIADRSARMTHSRCCATGSDRSAPAPKEAAGWLFGAGQLAMTAHDLALWNISIMNQSLLKPASYKFMQTDVLLDAGNATGYGLGVQVRADRAASGGFLMAAPSPVTRRSNLVYPDDKVAITVFTNIYPGAADAPGRLPTASPSIIMPPPAANAHGARAGATNL